MATWKKVIVSGSAAHLLNVTASNLTNDNLVVAGAGGALEDSGLTYNGSVLNLGSAQVQAAGFSGSFSGSFQGDGSGLTGIPATLSINAGSGGPSSVSLQSQTLTIAGTSNEVETSVSGQTITVGLPNDVIIGNNLTVTNDLIVNGTATYINTQNLYVEDKFILLASGSTDNGDGGIIIDRGGYASGNIAFGFDSVTGRWGFQDGVTDTATGIDPTSANGVSGSFVGMVFTEASHGATKPITGEFAKAGAIYTATNEDIWIYS